MLPLVLAFPLVPALTTAVLPQPMEAPSVVVTVEDRALSAGTQFQGAVDADQEVADPPVDSRAHGHVKVVIDDVEDTLRVQVTVTNLSGPAIGAHLHLGAAGVNGPIVVDLSSAITQQNAHVVKIHATLRASAVVGPLATERDRIGALLARLSTSGIYFNVHTQAYPTGEARGQL